MAGRNEHSRGVWWRWGFGLCCGVAWLCLPTQSHAICGLDAAAFDQVLDVDDIDVRRAWVQQVGRPAGTCVVCHLAGYGPRNKYGTAINMLVTARDRGNAARKREAGVRVNDIPADPSLPESPTFGDLIRRGLLPGDDLAANRAALENIPVTPPEEITVERAGALVRQAEEESRFGILQLSRTPDVSPEVAAELAEFRGEMLILGLRELSPEIAGALKKSQAGTVWLHSVTAVTPEAAAAIAEVPGILVLSGLVSLESVPLARKLTQRPTALSLPYLQEIGPEVAAALAECPLGLTLAALTDVSAEVQDALATGAASLSLPSLKSLDSLPLTRKLAEGYASAVLLPGIRALTVEQAELIAAVKRPFFLGGTLLPSSVMSEEVATVFAKNPAAGRLAVGAGAISDQALRILVESPVPIELREVTSLSDEQVRILAAAADRVPGGPFGSQPKIGLPMLTTLDSALLAETLLRCSFGFGNVSTISPEAASALGRVPEAAAGKPNPGLNFPGLAELSPETAQLLMNRRWAGISLPALQDAKPETVRSLVRQASCVTLGLTTITPEVAAVFGEMASDTTNLGGGTLELPCLSELSPEAARILVKALNRGEEVSGGRGLNRAPQLFIGGRGLVGISPPLTSALARELAQYRGRLSIAGVTALSDEAAEAIARHKGILELDGLTTLSAEMVKALTAADKLPGVLPRVTALDSPDSVAIAQALAARKGSVALPNLRKISPRALAALLEQGDVQIPPIETLKLIPEPDGSSTDDFVIPEGFQQRQQR